MNLDDLERGLEVGGVGIGLVFLSLVVFLLVIVALKRLFPPETSALETPGKSMDVVEQGSDKMPIGKVAAIAVGLALSLKGGARRPPLSSGGARSTWSTASGPTTWRTRPDQPDQREPWVKR